MNSKHLYYLILFFFNDLKDKFSIIIICTYEMKKTLLLYLLLYDYFNFKYFCGIYILDKQFK